MKLTMFNRLFLGRMFTWQSLPGHATDAVENKRFKFMEKLRFYIPLFLLLFFNSNAFCQVIFEGDYESPANSPLPPPPPPPGTNINFLVLGNPKNNYGQYVITNNAANLHRGWYGFDHTTGAGSFLAIDLPAGSNGPDPTIIVLEQEVTVVAGIKYTYSAWFKNLSRAPDPEVKLVIKGNSSQDITPYVTIPVTPADPDAWIELSGVWESDITGTCTLQIHSIIKNTTGSGTDFGIDDVFLKELCLDIEPVICVGENTSFTSHYQNANNYTWFLNDVQLQTGTNPVFNHEFHAKGHYTIKVEVDISGIMVTCEESFYVHEIPHVDFVIEYKSDKFIRLKNLSDQDEGYTYIWDFGDGNTSTDFHPVHTYSNYSTVGNPYTITLTGTSVCGSNIHNVPVHICQPRSAHFTYIETSPLNYSFHPTITDADHYYWDFYDGITSELTFPTHTYAEPGEYIVCLITTDECGLSSYCTPLEACGNFDFSLDKTDVCIDESIVATSLADVNVLSLYWTLNDRYYSDNPVETFHFTQPGPNKITLFTHTACGKFKTTQHVDVTRKPTAHFTVSYNVNTGLFHLKSIDKDFENIQSYAWKLNESIISTTGPEDNLSISNGNHQLCLIKENMCGSAESCQPLCILNGKLVCCDCEVLQH